MNHISHHGSFIEGGSGCDSCRNLFWAALWISFVPQFKVLKMQETWFEIAFDFPTSPGPEDEGSKTPRSPGSSRSRMITLHCTRYLERSHCTCSLIIQMEKSNFQLLSPMWCDWKASRKLSYFAKIEFPTISNVQHLFLSTINILELDPWQILV